MIRTRTESLAGPRPREPFEGRLAEEVQPLAEYARRRFGDGRALDVVQETLLRALAAESTFDPERPLGPWLRTIASNVASRLGERERRAPEVLEAPDAVPSRDDDKEHAETVEWLLSELSPAERTLLTRHHLEGESVASIAASLGAPEGTIKARLWRARRRVASLAALLAATGALAAALLLRIPHAEAPPARLLSSSAVIVRTASPEPRLERRQLDASSSGEWSVSGGAFVVSQANPNPSTSR